MTRTTNEALAAFTSAFLHNQRKGGATSTLEPEEWAQKIATILKPGPPFYSQINNSALIQALGDGALMNCDALRTQATTAKVAAGNDKPNDSWTGIGTIWSALDSLPAGASWGRIPGLAAASAESDEQDDGLWSSILISVDTNGENVALERSVVLPSHLLASNHFFRGNRSALGQIGVGKDYQWDDFASYKDETSTVATVSSYLFSIPYAPTIDLWSWPSWVPFLGSKGSKPDAEGDKPKDDNQGGKTPKGTKRVWIPSTTRTSFHAHWWGFTLYLPTPVMAELGKDADKAEQIAATISKILNALLEQAAKLPLPTPLQAAVTVLKSIAPVTQYISTFIGWSWDELKSLDKGQGICLSATWLLPVAMIPRSWDAPIAPPDQDGDGKPDGPPQPPSDRPNDKPDQKGGDKADDNPAKAPAGKAEEQPTGKVKEPPSAGSSDPSVSKPGEKPAGLTTEPVVKDGEGSVARGDLKPVVPTGESTKKYLAEVTQQTGAQPRDRPVTEQQRDGQNPKTDVKQATKKESPSVAQVSVAKSSDVAGQQTAPGKPLSEATSSDKKTEQGAPAKNVASPTPTRKAAPSPYQGPLPAGVYAPARRGSEPPAAGSPPAVLDPKKRAEYPRNELTSARPAAGAGVPPTSAKVSSTSRQAARH